MSVPRDNSHASASCAGVHPFFFAITSTRATRSRFFWKLSPWNRGLVRRQSSGARSSSDRNRPVRNPRPSGLYATKAMPSCRACLEQTLFGIASPQRVLSLQRGNRVRRRAHAESSPARLLTARDAGPCRPSTRSASAPTVSSIGVLSGRRDAGNRGRWTSTPRRWSDASHALRTYSGRPLTPRKLAVLGAHVAEFRRQRRPRSRRSRIARPTSRSLVKRPVDVGRVEKVDAEIERAMDRPNGSRLVATGVEVGHAHAAETDRGH